MKRKNATRNALLMSVLSMLLCISMLVGTTFAWFTDSVESGVNQIIAGNLDVEVYNSLNVGENKVDGDTKLFDEIKLWEPGVVAYENLTVANKGNMALKYQLSVNFENATKTPAGKTLADVLKVGFVENGIQSTTREGALSEVKEWLPLASFAQNGELEKQNDTDTYGIVIWWEPSDKDNDYNMNNGETTVLSIDLGIKLVATQLMAEEDSFGPDYDSLANPWDGSVGKVPAEENGVVTITTGAELAAFAESVNNGTTYSGKTVKLGANINLDNQLWTAIGDCESGKYFRGTFDGQGYTIYNLNVDYSTDESKHATAGLFAWVDAGMATIKNVKIDGATVKGSHWVGVIAGYFTGRIENCSVNNATVTAYNLNDDANGDKVGGIVGCLNEHSYLNNNTVTNSTITGNRDIGGIAGSVAASTLEMKNNKVTNVTINFATSKDYASAGEIVSGRTGYTPDDTNVATNVKFVKSVIVSTAEELAAALKNTDKDIVITLANSIDVPISSLGQQTGGSGEYKLAGEATETITIDLNNKKLNITTTYWSAIGAKNADATITIKNGDMTSTGNSADTWNAWDLRFSNCNWNFEDVDFLKAVALDNAGKVTNMKNVTITDSHNVDTYALWITSEGQTVIIDGLTVDMLAATDGRGIKIDNQYVDASSKVYLNVSNAVIKTEEKAAILVKSPAGADITLSNVNIDNVIDATNAVWIDEDAEASADLVTVTGGTKICESKVVTDSDALNDALKAGQTELLLAAGSYNVADGKSKTVTITGLSPKATIKPYNEGELGMDYGFDGATVTFDNVTIDTNANGGTYPGFARMGATFNNCIINGTFNLSSNEKTFNDCVFNVTGDTYNVWTWGVGKVTFDGCTFNCDGKSILVYNQNCDVVVKACTFNDNGTITGKAAIETGVDNGSTVYNIIITETTFNGFDITGQNSVTYGGTSLGTNVWGNKNLLPDANLNVTVDGKVEY